MCVKECIVGIRGNFDLSAVFTPIDLQFIIILLSLNCIWINHCWTLNRDTCFEGMQWKEKKHASKVELCRDGIVFSCLWGYLLCSLDLVNNDVHTLPPTGWMFFSIVQLKVIEMNMGKGMFYIQKSIISRVFCLKCRILVLRLEKSHP